jgi:hypothetical protein
MPLIIKGKSYPVPSESNQKGPTGSEIIEIENYFNLDGLLLLSSLANDNPPIGYTKTKGIYAMAWIALTRAKEIVSISDVLNDYSVDDFDFVDEADQTKKEVTEG